MEHAAALLRRLRAERAEQFEERWIEPELYLKPVTENQVAGVKAIHPTQRGFSLVVFLVDVLVLGYSYELLSNLVQIPLETPP